MKRLATQTVFATLLLTTANARAASAIDFGPLFPEHVRRTVVVVIPPTPTSRKVEQAVADALITSGRIDVAVSSSALGTYKDLEDGAIEQRALKLGVDSVVIARVNGSGESVRLAVLHKEGLRRGEMTVASARPGGPLVKRIEDGSTKWTPPSALKGEPPHEEGTSQPHSVDSPPAQPAAPRAYTVEERRAYYDEKYVGFREQRRIEKIQPYEGRFERLLGWPEFYDKVGESQLARQSRLRRDWGRVLLGIGVLLSVGGSIAFPAQAAANSATNFGIGGDVAGALMLTIGAGAIVGGSLIPTNVVPAWDARRLGFFYNARLKQQLVLAQ
jgi:hypothetical protein